MLFALYAFVLFFPLTSFTSILLLTHGLSVVKVILARYCDDFSCACLHSTAQKSGGGERTDNNVVNRVPQVPEPLRRAITQLLLEGEHIVSLLEGMEGAQGKLAFDECAVSLVIGIFGGYLTLSVAFIVGKAHLRFIISFFFANFFTTVAYGYRLVYTAAHGQDIEDEIAGTIQMLRSKIAEYAEVLGSKQLAQLQAMKENFEDFRGLEPRKMFRLNGSMLLSILSAIITYLIVLLQFKTGDDK